MQHVLDVIMQNEILVITLLWQVIFQKHQICCTADSAFNSDSWIYSPVTKHCWHPGTAVDMYGYTY